MRRRRRNRRARGSVRQTILRGNPWRANFKRRNARRGRDYGSTAQWGKPTGFTQFRGRKLRPRQWRKILWRDTIAETKWRSIGAIGNSLIGALTGLGSGVVYLFPAVQNDPVTQPFITQPFWTLTGGVQATDRGIVPPLFTGDLVLRGGFARISVVNPETIPIRVKVYAIWANKLPSLLVYNSTHNNLRNMEWDPSIEPDFNQFGKVIARREVMLLPGANPFEMIHRLKVQKIDQNVFTGESVPGTTEPAGSQLWWGVQAVPLTTNPVSDNVQIIRSYNLSFTGDEVGTT